MPIISLLVNSPCIVAIFLLSTFAFESTSLPLDALLAFLYLLIKLIEEYNVKLLSTKIYWERPTQREKYKEFWAKYNKIEKIENKEEQMKQKEILFVTNDLKEVCQNENKYYKIIKFYKDRLTTLGAMKALKNTCISQGQYTGKEVLCKI